MKRDYEIHDVKFRFTERDNEVTGVVVNPGGWFGKVWLIQINIANALQPTFAVEADTEQDAIDEFADCRWSHLIDVDEEDWPQAIEGEDGEVTDEENDYSKAGNDSHWVDLSNVHINHAPADLRYTIEWHPLQDGLGAVIDGELGLVRDEMAD